MTKWAITIPSLSRNSTETLLYHGPLRRYGRSQKNWIALEFTAVLHIPRIVAPFSAGGQHCSDRYLRMFARSAAISFRQSYLTGDPRITTACKVISTTPQRKRCLCLQIYDGEHEQFSTSSRTQAASSVTGSKVCARRGSDFSI
jgi:hypothetical protein